MINDTPKRIAMYVMYDKDGILDGFRRYYLEQLRPFVDRIVTIVQGTITPESRLELENLSEDIYVRENTGLLAGAWIAGLQHIGWDNLKNYDELLMLNDSFFGPFYPLDDFFNACEQSDADFYGITKGFEDKKIKMISSRNFKHGWYRGAINYFYIIKKHLLHSAEFREYWNKNPEIICDWDAWFFQEINFCDYVKDCGFKVDAYQSDLLKGYDSNALSRNIYMLIRYENIPFARIRSFGTDIKARSMQIGYAQDPRKALQYIKEHTNYDTNLIWDYLLRTKNLTNIYNQLQLEYVVSNQYVEGEYTYNKSIGVILHIYYTDLVEKIAKLCENFPENTDYYISTINQDTKEKIEKEFSKRKFKFICQIKPNVGVAESTLWVTYADIVKSEKYEYIAFLHDKKSPYADLMVVGEQFGERLYNNLFSSKQTIKNIINLFEKNKRMGMVGAPPPYHGNYFSVVRRSWRVNFENTVNLAKKLGLQVDINKNIPPVAPYGTMFWARSKVLKKAISINLSYEDFNVEYKTDGTLMHAMERLYGLCAQDSGYYYANVLTTDNARADLINYQYILDKSCEILIGKGEYTYTFEKLKYILNIANFSEVSIRIPGVKFLLKLQKTKCHFMTLITCGKRKQHYKNKKRKIREMLQYLK